MNDSLLNDSLLNDSLPYSVSARRTLLVYGAFALCFALLFLVIRTVPATASILVPAANTVDTAADEAATDETASSEIDSAQSVEIRFETVVEGLEKPVDIQHAGDQRLFVIEKPGRIRVIDSAENLLGTPFLNIEGRVDDDGWEEGLLGMAFHPNYATNGHFYVNYTIRSSKTRIARFTVSADNANVANADSEVVLMEFEQTFDNHNGGQIQFGPDGYLYIATGDGGSGGDPNNAGQDQTQLLGKILRVDVDGNSSDGPECDESGNSNYTIPDDNPFGDGDDGSNCDEIWATGLRNPWRFSFDSATGDMWIGDVGQNAREEINFQAGSSGGGENYGWRCFEGNADFEAAGCQSASTYVGPVHDYDRDDGRSVTGGMVYRGSRFLELAGHYFFADYATGNYWTLSGNPSSPTLSTINVVEGSAGNPTAFGTDSQGELYVASDASGSIVRIVGSGPSIEPIPIDVNPRFLPLIATP